MKKITAFKKTPQNINKMFKGFGLLSLLMTALLLSVGATEPGVMFAAGGVLATNATPGAVIPGVGTVDAVRAASVDLLDDSVSSKVTEMFPSKTPISHIMRQIGIADHDATGGEGKGAYIHRFYSIDYRPITTVTASAYTAANQRTATLSVDNAKMFTKDDTLKPVFSTPTAAQRGYRYEGSIEQQIGDLQLIVVNIDYGSNTITVQAVNGKRATAAQPDTVYVPSIDANTTLVRITTALSEMDSQTGKWMDVPTDTYNFIQTPGAQFELTPEFQEHFKEISWSKAAILERKVRELIESEERNILFGEMSEFVDAVELDHKYTMGGLWSGISNIFPYNKSAGFTKEIYNAMMRQLFANNSGDTIRFGFIGSGFAERLLNIQETVKYSTSATPVEKFGMKFSGFSNVFGTVNTMLHPMLDLCGHADDAIIVDVSNLALVRWGALERHEYDLRPQGKNVFANVLKEKLSLEIRYPQTHMIIKGS
jgi:hypothetical protein